MGERDEQALALVQLREIADARAAGAEFFMELPDGWYEPEPTYGCPNGHVWHVYIKSETRGHLCPECQRRVVLLPGHYTNEKLKAAIADAAATIAQEQKP